MLRHRDFFELVDPSCDRLVQAHKQLAFLSTDHFTCISPGSVNQNVILGVSLYTYAIPNVEHDTIIRPKTE